MIHSDTFSLTGANQKIIIGDLTYDDKNANAPLVIFVHGFKGFKDWGAHQLTARYFAQNGYRYLKFNFSHSGVNPEQPIDVNDLETFAANTFSKEMLDLDLIINYAIEKLKIKQVFLIGHSRGGGLSILQASNTALIKGLVTWSSIADFSSLWRKEQENDWKKEGKIYVENARTKEKMPLNISLLNDFECNSKKLNILEAAKKVNIPWLIIQGDEDINVPFETAQKLSDSNPKARLIKIESANHVYGASHPFESNNLPAQLLKVCEETIAFLNQIP